MRPSAASASPAPSRRSASATPSVGSSRSVRAGSSASAAFGGETIEDTGAGFSQRNLYYLRSSPYTVLQMVLYLDARHTAWMNAPSEEANGLRANGEVIMQKALAVLRTRIMDKLRRESGSGGRMGVVSRKEKVDVYASYDFQMAYFFRKMSDRHAVLLKDKSLVFPHSAAPMPLATDPAAGNAPIPSISDRASKRRRVEGAEMEGNDLFLSDEGPSSAADLPAPVKAEADAEGAEALLHSSAGQDITGDGSFYDPLQDDYLGDPDQDANSAEALKPRLRVKVSKERPSIPSYYSGFRIFGKMLVVVIEPSKSVIADHPELFGGAQPKEVRQLSVTPMPGGAAGRASSRSRTQSRLTSVRAPSTGFGSRAPAPDSSSSSGAGARTAREDSRRDSRAPSPGIGATLFLGGTPTPTPEPDGRRFGSRGVSRAMSATPGPGPGPGPGLTPAGSRSKRRRDDEEAGGDGDNGSPEPRTNELAQAINQRSGQTVRKLPPVPLFDAGGDGADREGEDEQEEGHQNRRAMRQSQAPSPTPEPSDSSARPRAPSIMPRRAPPPEGVEEDGDAEADVDMAFDFGDNNDGQEHNYSDEEEDEEPPTGLALATQMMEAGGHAGQRGLEAEDGE
ncbi:hypothetical protein OC835_002778 [Tilletia horrida]|nr:hypothetical protein OC835_002778 [Tilletia horrida]